MIPKSIVIVGGGTAGWMTANLMMHHWQDLGVNITLIESSEIGTIGVGEGSTPFLRYFFETLGIQEKQWMPLCDATFKCGIGFPDWCNHEGNKHYFHPFYNEIDNQTAVDFMQSCQHRRQGFDTPCLPDDYFATAHLAYQNKAPYDAAKKPIGVDYGYHFDAAKLGAFMAQHAIKLGVERIIDTVDTVYKNAESIRSIETKNHGQFDADLFIDCSGLSGLLIQQTLSEKLISYQDYLPNNRAVAIGTSHDEINGLGSYTVSKGLSAGWMWQIPLQSRVGNGYVYSDKYLTNEQAEQELRQALNNYDSPALHLKWTPGRIENHWKANCLAVGMSQGFLEPLEAPMLNLVQQTVELFIEKCSTSSEQQKKQYNLTINNLVDGTRDYLQAHYATNSRTDSQYWNDNRNNQHRSSALNGILTSWLSQSNFEMGLADHQDVLVYGKTSWYCLLAGMSYFPNMDKKGLKLIDRKHRRALSYCQQLSQRSVHQRDVFDTTQEYI